MTGSRTGSRGFCMTFGLILALAPTGPAGAADDRPRAPCDCRASSGFWPQGAETCIDGTIHVCGMSQNVSAWITTRRGCPLAYTRPRLSRQADSAFFSSRSE